MDTIRISLLHSKYPISYNKKYISHFLLFVGQKLTQVRRIKSVLRINIFPLNLLSCVQKALKNMQTKFHSDRMKNKHFIEVSNTCPTITLTRFINCRKQVAFCTNMSHFTRCIMGFIQFWINMADYQGRSSSNRNAVSDDSNGKQRQTERLPNFRQCFLSVPN